VALVEGPRMPRTKRHPKARRRTRGEGTVYSKTRTWTTTAGKVRSKTLWVAAVSEGRAPTKDGATRRSRKFFYGDTAAEARAMRDAYLRAKGEQPPQETETDLTTFSDFVARFLREWKKRPTRRGTPHSQATLDSYSITLRVHVEPTIGALPIRSISKDDIRRLYAKLDDDPDVSPSMVARVHRTLSVLFNFALEEDVIEKSPLATISRSHKRPTVKPLEESQISALLKASKNDRLGAMIVLAIDSGARQGELFALKWRDLNFAKRMVYIHKNASETTAGVVLLDPKTPKSLRTITVSSGTIDALKHRREIAKREGFASEDDFVFPSLRGFVLRKSNFLRETWNPIRKAAKLPSAKFHGLRHACATLLLKAGVHPKVVQERLGHESITLTMDTYSHVLEGLQGEAAAKIGGVLGRLANRKADHKS
jgi:integrase